MVPTIIVTGASRGLGEALSRSVANLGANVVLNARSILDLDQLVREIEDNGGKAVAVPGDVSLVHDCQRIVEGAVESYGRIDALVNNAAIVEPIALIARTDPAEWMRSYLVNVFGPMVLTQAALPFLRETNGRVINVSSGAAERAIAGAAAYCATKGALNQFNRVLAAEEDSITAIAVRPGVVDTPMQTAIRTQGQAGMPDDVYRRFVRYHQNGELLPPEVPGRTLAILALHAPNDWSGEFLSWDEDKVKQLVQRFG
jgi:NAD(P)-dependent dehydrogenase (short-subunit alcohol dehydrogenase family)